MSKKNQVPLLKIYQYVLILIRILELEVSCSHEYSFNGPHAIVVMELGGKLLRAEPIGHHNLYRQRLCIEEAIRIQRDLSDERIVGDHHGDRAKQHLLREREKDANVCSFKEHPTKYWFHGIIRMTQTSTRLNF